MSFTISGAGVTILEFLYDQWFVEYYRGKMPEEILAHLGRPESEMIHALELLEEYGLIEHHDGLWYKITNHGIDKFEEALPPTRISRRKQQRKLLLEKLAEVYKEKPRDRIDNNTLSEKTGIVDQNELIATVEFLRVKGHVDGYFFQGGFQIKLTAAGFQSLQMNEYDASTEMTSAYRILFQLENHLRQFVEKSLRDKFGADWWEKGVPFKKRENADKRHKEESAIGWKISITNSDMEYLWFEDLEGIIAVNWKDVFSPVLKDQESVTLRLKELETLRNAIAHTRTLSPNAMSKLEQLSNELYALTR